MEKPKTILEYKKWLKREHEVKLDQRYAIYYELASNSIKREFEGSAFWTDLLNNLREYNQEYQLARAGYILFSSDVKPTLKVKSFLSFLEKTFRKNVLENHNFPNQPNDGWVLPENWFSQIKDTVRTLFIVRYFDGVEFLATKIQEFCEKHNTKLSVDLEAREEGYYAAHLHIAKEFEIPQFTMDTRRILVPIEFQITTQVQEVIRKLLHNYYEKKRIMTKKPIEKWQWDYKCDEFCANYLGHILHYLEGMIMEVRERQKKAIK